jgi:hypothetical protein
MDPHNRVPEARSEETVKREVLEQPDGRAEQEHHRSHDHKTGQYAHDILLGFA